MKKFRWKWDLRRTSHGIALAATLLATGIVAGCYPKAGPAPGPVSPKSVASASTRWPGATAESLAAGHDLFIANCNKCHDYPDLTVIDDQKWPDIVDRMGHKADLTPQQIELVLHFVQTARSEQVGKP